MRLLVVEDDPSMNASLRQGLSEAGYAVDAVLSGRDGLDYALASDYDLLILDIMLPGMDGLELLARLRDQSKRTPVLLLTARTRSKIGSEGWTAGPTITWSNHSTLTNCWHGCVHCCAVLRCNTARSCRSTI